MSFDKNYPRRKDWRKPYIRKAQQLVSSCRPNGGCPWCENNRLHSKRVQEEKANYSLKELSED